MISEKNSFVARAHLLAYPMIVYETKFDQLQDSKDDDSLFICDSFIMRSTGTAWNVIEFLYLYATRAEIKSDYGIKKTWLLLSLLLFPQSLLLTFYCCYSGCGCQKFRIHYKYFLISQHKKKVKGDDSLWTARIILFKKCLQYTDWNSSHSSSSRDTGGNEKNFCFSRPKHKGFEDPRLWAFRQLFVGTRLHIYLIFLLIIFRLFLL